jgi:hypothetical protein
MRADPARRRCLAERNQHVSSTVGCLRRVAAQQRPWAWAGFTPPGPRERRTARLGRGSMSEPVHAVAY